MKGKIVLFFILVAGFFALMPEKTNAACCEYRYTPSGVSCSAGTSQESCDTIAKTYNGLKGNIEKKYHTDGKYYPKKECMTPSVWDKKCECPNGKNCLELQIPFPGSKTIEDAAFNQQFSDIIAKYIIRIFQLGIWIAISLAIFMIMLAGFIWLISAGNMGLIGKAKGYISNALYGLIVALLSFLLLQTINPKLVELKMPALNTVTPVTSGSGKDCCYNTDTLDVKDGISLISGTTCQDAFNPLLGGTWKQCKESGVPKIGPCCACFTGTNYIVASTVKKMCFKGLNISSCAGKVSWFATYIGTDFGGNYGCKSYLWSCDTLPTADRPGELWCDVIN